MRNEGDTETREVTLTTYEMVDHLPPPRKMHEYIHKIMYIF